jgi:uncharacterized protein (DUF983 family)
MTTELKERTYYRTTETDVSTAAKHYRARRSWTPCPRCIGGNMYQDTNGEHVCIQCGYSYFPGRHQSLKVG